MALFDGTSGKDNLVGTGSADRLNGHGGADTLSGQGGDDALVGGAGNDWLYGGTGNDTMDGGGGNDFFFVTDIRDRVVEAPGGGVDHVRTSLAIHALPANVEQLTYLPFDGHLPFRGVGNDLDNEIVGGMYNDTLLGGKGNDTLIGNGGSDVLDGGSGADVLIGGSGSDTYYFNTGDRIVESAGDNRDLVMSWIDLTLPDFLDDMTLIGTATIANGNNRDNRVTGNALNNLLQGGQGNDTVSGMDGNDTIVGGKGRDTLTGGNGDDVFKFTNIKDSAPSQKDIVTDLRPGDKLDFSVIDANPITAFDEAFTQVAAFSGHAGELRLTYFPNADRTEVSLEVTGDLVADFVVQVMGQHTSSAGWML